MLIGYLLTLPLPAVFFFPLLSSLLPRPCRPQAAEKLVLTAFQLQIKEPQASQDEAKAFLTKIANDVGEAPGPVIALVRAVVQPAPWGSGYLVVRVEGFASFLVIRPLFFSRILPNI